MAAEDVWAIGVDLGGTKIGVARVGEAGELRQRLRLPTRVKEGPGAIKAEILAAVSDLLRKEQSRPSGVGVGVAGQVDPYSGVVRFAPNLDWQDVALQADLSQELGLPVVVMNDVRAATWGEWLHGAGLGCSDLICLFVGTGIGGGIVSNGEIVSGYSNTAGELGHITIDLHGPPCRCGNRGCLEALAGGWAIAKQAQEAIAEEPAAGSLLLQLSDGRAEAITAKTVVQAALEGDTLSKRLIESATEALIVGAVSLVHAFNPRRLILGGGVIEGMPHFVGEIAREVKKRALSSATTSLQVVPAKLKNDAGVVGAATVAIQRFKKEG